MFLPGLTTISPRMQGDSQESSASRLRRGTLQGDARSRTSETPPSPTAARACSSADLIPSITKWNIVPYGCAKAIRLRVPAPSECVIEFAHLTAKIRGTRPGNR